MCWLSNISPQKTQVAMEDDMLMLATEDEEINQIMTVLPLECILEDDAVFSE